MSLSQRSGGASASQRTISVTTVGDPAPMICYQYGKERTQRPQVTGTAGAITYRGVRGLKHKNDRLQRSVTTNAMLDRPPGLTANERPRHSVNDQRSSDHRRPVHSPPSRRSASADRQIASTSTPRTFFETLYHDKVEEINHKNYLHDSDTHNMCDKCRQLLS